MDDVEHDRVHGAVFQTIGTLLFVYNMVWSYFKATLPGLIRGTRGLWSGPPPRLRQPITSR